MMTRRPRRSETTARAMKLYAEITRFYAEHEYMPSIREMMPMIDIKTSTSHLNSYVQILIGWGWLTRLPIGGRNLKLNRTIEHGKTPKQLRKMLKQEEAA